MPQRHYLRGYLCAGGGAVIWGLTGTAGQYLLHHYTIDSFWISSVRLIGAGLFLMLMAAPHYRAMKDMLKVRRNVILLLCYSIFGLLMSQTAFYTTIQYANAGTAAVLQTLCVVMMAVIVCFRGHRLPTRTETLSVFLALAGVFLIATNGDPSTMVLSSKALMWGLITAVASVCYSFLAQDLVWHWGSITVNALGMFIGGVVFCCFLQPWTIPTDLDMTGYLLLAAVVLIGTVLTYNLFLRGVGDIGPVKATLLGTLEPVTSSIASAVFLGTVFYLPELIGFACILATVFLVTLQRRQPA